MTVYGYARVSSTDQCLDVQIAALKAAGCEVIRSEKKSGTSTAERTELRTVMEFARSGDVLCVTRVDRLARSVADLQVIVSTLKEKGVALRATEQPIDTSSPAGKAFLDMLCVFAEFETNLRRERQLEGIAKAKAEGRYAGKGRPSKISAEKIFQLHQNGKGPGAIATELGISRMSVYRALKPRIRSEEIADIGER